MLFYLLRYPGMLLPGNGDLLMDLTPKYHVEFLDLAVFTFRFCWVAAMASIRVKGSHGKSGGQHVC